MKISCLQENLSRGLGIVGRAVATRTTLPITSNVLLTSDQGRLRLVATNLEIALSCWIGAKVEEEGAITVPARLLADFVGSLPAERMDMALSQPRTLHLKCARFEARISGQDASDFPPIPKVSEGVAARLEAPALRKAIAQSVFAAATEDTRPVLTGINLEMEDQTLTLAAADGFRLAVYNLPLPKAVSGKTVAIVPARALAELNRLLGDQEEPVEMVLNTQKGQVRFTLKNAELVSQLIQGTFPNYGQLIPQSFASLAVVNTAEFLRAVRTASTFARDGSGIVRVMVTPGGELGPGKLTITARAEELGDNVGEIDAQVSGEAAKVAFNSKYLSDVLGVLDSEKVALDTTSPSSPGVLRPVGVENYTHVVMPMFVQW